MESDVDDPCGKDVQLNDYMVYCHLVKLGFIVRRAVGSETSRMKECSSHSTRETSKVELLENEPIIKTDEYGKLNCVQFFYEPFNIFQF
jgi:hypothetical protein